MFHETNIIPTALHLYGWSAKRIIQLFAEAPQLIVSHVGAMYRIRRMTVKRRDSTRMAHGA
jgi:hypothetical protein